LLVVGIDIRIQNQIFVLHGKWPTFAAVYLLNFIDLAAHDQYVLNSTFDDKITHDTRGCVGRV